MSRSKKLFLIASTVFIALLIWASYDISTRTTFPGSKPQLKERIRDNYTEESENVKDTIGITADSTLQYGKKKQISD